MGQATLLIAGPKQLRRRFSKGQKLRLWPTAFVQLSPEQAAELRQKVNRERPIGDLILEIIERYLEEERSRGKG